MHFFDADGLSRKDLAEVDLVLAQTDATAPRDHDGFVVEQDVLAKVTPLLKTPTEKVGTTHTSR